MARNTCKVVNFSDRLGDLHTCGFTLRPDYAQFFNPRYTTLDPARPEDQPYYDYATDVYLCWDQYPPDTMPRRPASGTFSDLAFSAKGQPYCWGNGSLGQHGRGEVVMADARPSPDRPAGNDNTYYNGIASSDYLNCGWLSPLSTGTGEVQCWGADPSGLVKGLGRHTPREERLIYHPHACARMEHGRITARQAQGDRADGDGGVSYLRDVEPSEQIRGVLGR